MRMQSQAQRNKQIVAQAAPSSSKAGASGLRRPSGLPAPMSRGGASGIAVPRASVPGVGGARRASTLMSTSTAVGGGGRLGSTGVKGPVKGGASASGRLMRRV